MAQLKRICIKIILIIVTISLLITFCAMPSSYAKLDLQDGEFYYSGTQKGQYTVSDGIFKWLLSKIGDIADWLLGIITMGFRMIFIGWTALLEKMLTWALETTSGISMSGDIVESNTDITSITDSANNVTIGAIVYNHVPALDANIFNLKEDPEHLKYSGTGRLLVCKECGTEPNDDVTKEGCCTLEGTCACECNGKCDDCKAYLDAVAGYNARQEENSDAEKPIIFQIKEAVATWYYIITMLALAAMLVLLIFIGIKMAISTVASEKAVYKRMLVDWLVGLIIIFTMNFIMVIVETSADAIHSVQMKELAEKDSIEGVEYTNADLEIKVYEAVRTRAYDAKLLNGISGMIMYMTLVYFAFRYTLVYIKRMFTLIVLSIMAPAIGVGYALQKALTGKQQVLKTWLSEYVLNVIIQVVHAIIYSVFIAQALILSLESISGLIVALILMNYTLEADKLFRKIFKISTSGLVDDTNNAEDQFKSGLMDAVIGGKAAVNTLAKESPYTKAVAGVGKAALAAPALGIGAARGIKGLITKKSNSNSGEPESHDSASNEPESHDSGSNGGNSQNSGGQQNNGNSGSGKGIGKLPRRSDKELLETGKKTLKSNLDKTSEALITAKTPQQQKQAWENHLIATDEFNRYKEMTTPSTGKIALGHMERLVDIENHYVFKNASKGNALSNLKALYTGIYGNTYIDRDTGKRVNDKSGYYMQFAPSNLLGLTDADKKLLKKQFSVAFGVIPGMASMLVGMGTLVANPKLGMGLLASGTALTNRGLGSRRTSLSSYKGKYTFSKFSIPAIKNMRQIALKNAQKEYKEMKILDLKERRKGTYRAIKTGTVALATVALSPGGVLLTSAAIGAGLVGTRLIAKTNLGQGMEEMETHLAKQQKKQEKEFQTETLNVIKAEAQAKMAFLLAQENSEDEVEKSKKQLYDALGYSYDEDTKTLTKKTNMSDSARKEETFENKLEILLMAKSEENENNSNKQNPDVKVVNNIIEDKAVINNVDTTKLTEADIKFMDKEIDNILIKMSAGEALDIDNQATLTKAMDELTDKLVVAGIISNNQNAEEVFKSGKTGLRRALKQKADIANAKIEVAAQALEDIVGEDREEIKQSIVTISKDKGVTDFKQITASEVLGKMNSSRAQNPSARVLTPEENRVYGEKINNFLSGLEIAKKATHTTGYEQRNKVKKQVNYTENKRKKKLEQILEMSFDTNHEDPTTDLINQVTNIKSTGGTVKSSNGNSVQITSDESNRVLEFLFARKELEEVNNVAMEELDVKKGSYNFTKATKAKNEATIAYYADELEIRKYAMDNQTIYRDKDYMNKPNTYTQEQIEKRKEIADLEKNLQGKKEKMRKAERDQRMRGPIVDLNEVRQQLLGDKK